MNGAGVVALTTPGVKLLGKFTFLDVQRQVLDAVMRDGEALVFIHEGRSNPRTGFSWNSCRLTGWTSRKMNCSKTAM